MCKAVEKGGRVAVEQGRAEEEPGRRQGTWEECTPQPKLIIT